MSLCVDHGEFVALLLTFAKSQTLIRMDIFWFPACFKILTEVDYGKLKWCTDKTLVLGPRYPSIQSIICGSLVFRIQ